MNLIAMFLVLTLLAPHFIHDVNVCKKNNGVFISGICYTGSAKAALSIPTAPSKIDQNGKDEQKFDFLLKQKETCNNDPITIWSGDLYTGECISKKLWCEKLGQEFNGKECVSPFLNSISAEVGIIDAKTS
jgi:hypothetical protein